MFGIYSFQDLQSLLSDIYGGRRIDVRPFGYTFDFSAVVDNGIAVATQKIIGNADFIVCSASFSVRNSAENVGDSTMQIEDSGSQERFFNQSTPIQQFATTMNGAGVLAARGLTFPRRVAGNSTLTATLTAGGTITNPQLYLDGVHVYVYGD
jgi:hypothetical protein